MAKAKTGQRYRVVDVDTFGRSVCAVIDCRGGEMVCSTRLRRNADLVCRALNASRSKGKP